MNDDLISRKEAITAIQKAYADTVRGMDKCAVWKNVGLTHALHIMQDLPSAQPERTETHSCDYQRTVTHDWIPVTEALPEDACQCIVTAKVKHVDNYPDYEVDTADFADGIFTTTNSWWGVESIIAWMPLPEPYKEGQE